MGLYHELSAYTLALQDQSFIHQLVVDAYAAQHAGPYSRPITVFFALIGLYLTFERNYNGRQVQRVHLLLAKNRRTWPSFTRPDGFAALTVQDVLEAAPGEARLRRIRDWARAVWEMWAPEQARGAAAARACL